MPSTFNGVFDAVDGVVPDDDDFVVAAEVLDFEDEEQPATPTAAMAIATPA